MPFYAILCMEFYAKGRALTRVMCGCLYSVVVAVAVAVVVVVVAGFACSGWLGSVSEARRGPAPKEASLR